VPVNEIVCTRPLTNLDRVVWAKRIFRNAREARGLSRTQLARMLGYESERLLRAYEDEDAENNVPVAALMHPDLPAEMFEQIVEKIRQARGEDEPLGADTPADAMCALERSVGQFIVWKGTVGLAAVSARTAPQGLQIVETLKKNAGIAVRFLSRAITGSHVAARGAR
jgi:predicted transcriptional regulator